MSDRKIVKPLNPLVFKIAGELAATWYEVGRSQGLQSKWPNARAYAKANLEKFVPKSIEYMLAMLANPSFNHIAKSEIYDALLEINESGGHEKLPDINMKALDEIVKRHAPQPELPKDLKAGTALQSKAKNPFLGKGH